MPLRRQPPMTPPPGAPAAESYTTPPPGEWFIVLLDSEPDPGQFTGAEQQLAGDGTWEEKTGGRVLADENRGVELVAGSLASGDYAWARSAPGAGGHLWELVPISGLPAVCAVNVTQTNLDAIQAYEIASLAIPAAGTYLIGGTFTVHAAVGMDSTPTAPAIIGSVRAFLWDCEAQTYLTHNDGSMIIYSVAPQVIGFPNVTRTTLFPLAFTDRHTFLGPARIQVHFSRTYDAAAPSISTLELGRLDGEMWWTPVSVATDCLGDECGSGVGSGSGGDEGEEYFDLGSSVEVTFSGGDGDCGCLDALTVTLTQLTATIWQNVSDPFDSSGCPDGDAVGSVELRSLGGEWQLLGLGDDATFEFVSQDEGTSTVVFRVTGSVGTGSSVCTGTFLVTAVGTP